MTAAAPHVATMIDVVPIAARVLTPQVICWSHNCREEAKIGDALVGFGNRGGLHYNDLCCPRCGAKWRQFVVAG